MVSKGSDALLLKTMNDTLQAMLSTVLRELSLQFPCSACPDAPIVENASCYVLRIVPGIGTMPKKIVGAADVLKLRLALPESLDLRFSIDRGAVVIEVPKLDHQRNFVKRTDLEASITFPPNELIATIGQSTRGETVTLNFSNSASPHLLIGGATGSGKSIALATILDGLCANYSFLKLRLMLIDPKQVELSKYANSRHLLRSIGYSPEDALAILDEAIVEMEHRYSIFRSNGTVNLAGYNAIASSTLQKPSIVVVIDEYADLVNTKQVKGAIEERLQRLAAKGRAAGIHIILATQKPSAAVISTTIRSNFPAKLALRVCKAADSRILLDENGAEALAGKGDALLSTAAGLVRLQTAM
jgi:DNA phosphorothioation-dependent restriction protein DptH